MLAPGSLTRDVIRRLADDRPAAACFAVIAVYVAVALLAHLGLVAADFDREVGAAYQAPSARHWLGTDFLGRDVLLRVIHGAKIALGVGLIASLIAIPIGAGMGALAGYYGGLVDALIVWLYSTVNSVPWILLMVALSLVLGKGIFAVYVAIGLTSWVGICRLIRGEFIRRREQEYVLAATALNASDLRLIFRHILPNVAHLIVIDFSLRFVGAIKAEVILSYLGLGAQGEPSWGVMIADARQELVGRGVWWPAAAATLAMFVLVLAFNIFGDALRDALDPRLRRGEE